LEDIFVTKVNAVYIQIGAKDNGILREISEFFTFEVPGAKFSPRVRNNMWDGKIRLFKLIDQTLYIGLYEILKKFAEEREYTIKEFDEILPSENVTFDEYKTFMNSLNVHSKGNKITPYDYQEKTVFTCLKSPVSTVVSPTSSGKSLIIYSLVRWHLQSNKKIIIVVPNVQLVTQLFEDFGDYSSEIDWNVSKFCHKIYSGQEKNSDKLVTITTWQSMQKLPASYFKKFDVLMVDECHLAAANQLQKIGQNCSNAFVRHGFTGTLQETKCHKLTILGLLGPERNLVSTKQLMDGGYVTPLKIKCVVLKYNKDDVKKLRSLTVAAKKEKSQTVDGKKRKGNAYADEMNFICSHKERMKFLIQLCEVTKGNTLVLFQYVEKHGHIIHKELLTNSQKSVYYIHGNIDVKEREKIVNIMEKRNDVVVVASYGVFSTGINVKNIENIIIASPMKSEIKILQSIGRGLRLNKGKKKVTLYDIVDDITHITPKRKFPNYVIRHFWDRFKIYKKQKFDLKVYERPLK
jgi:superfamily II DNA or RNA helicase